MPTIPWRSKKGASISEGQTPRDHQPTSDLVESTLTSKSTNQSRQNSLQPPSLRNTSVVSEHATTKSRSPRTIRFLKRRTSHAVREVDANAADQSACAFLTVIPYDIRELVYMHLIDEDDWIIPLREVKENPAEAKKMDRARRKGRVGDRNIDFTYYLNLMSTCRAIHEETIDMLYKNAHVCIPTLTTFQNFFHHKRLSAGARAQRMALRSLTLTALFPYLLFNEREGGPRADPDDPAKILHYNSAVWAATTDTLLRLAQLKRLRLEMVARDYRDIHPNWPDRPSARLQRFLLAPLGALAGLDDFVVCVSWPLDESQRERDAATPYELRRLGEEASDARLVAEPDGWDEDGPGDGDPHVVLATPSPPVTATTMPAAQQPPDPVAPATPAQPAVAAQPAPAQRPAVPAMPIGYRPTIPTFYG